ncbi:YycH family regulatory protein [Fictibacillus sp. BK138]|uniref:YycH family regulatory protein n=1 Tax=Fictibacillus sp. BK138 TaxID=2512121 RepID=UPI00102A41C8|nr:two-component system activity regulator YycH [Fictibacillus sp. BK138]RZT20995.1 regulatory protein YycH of two-component signal transduction system YycFG [Fictibacillus sp. BK138]
MNWLKWITHARKIITLYRENYEFIKSITLTALILLSLVLTWSLWTFKPSHPLLEDARTVKKQEVEDPAEIKDVVNPTQVIYHSGNKLYGAEANEVVEKFHNLLNETKFIFETGTKNNRTFDPEENFLNDIPHIEVIYPVDMTKEIYKEVFSIESEITANKPNDVDRIFLFQNPSTESIEGYLVSYETKKMHKIKASNNNLLPLIKNMNEMVTDESMVPYISYDIEEREENGMNEIKQRFYFPKNKLKLNRYNYISRPTTEDTYEMYKKALFKDPQAVKSATGDNEITYADGTAAMVVKILQNRFAYTNFAGSPNPDTIQISPLFQSVEYINTHAGWGNPYILSNLGSSTDFWLFVENLPVLDPEMQMSLTWYENELQEYERSLVQLDLSETSIPSSLTEEITIQSGDAVLRKLKESDYNTNYIKDIRIGYTMKKREPHLYMLEPQWFIKYDIKGWELLFKEDGEEGF